MKNLTTSFETLESAKSSVLFLSGNFARLIENYNTGRFEIEVEDYGTQLSHQRSICFGKYMDMTPSIH